MCYLWETLGLVPELRVSHADPTKACWELSLSPESPELEQSPDRSPAFPTSSPWALREASSQIYQEDLAEYLPVFP